MAMLMEAAGWPASLTSSAPTHEPRIYAFDWRTAVASTDALAALPSDVAILSLVSLDTLDQADALLDHHSARCVVGQDPVDIATALADLNALTAGASLHDGQRSERARLQALAMELARLADRIGEMAPDDGEALGALAERNLGYQAETPMARGPATPPDAGRIRHMISTRRLRDRFFSADLFADPAWDILLDLAAARLEQRPVSVSSLCIAAAVPPTTALRWIRLMTDQQLLERRADPLDARRMFVELSDAAFDQLCGWFALVDGRGAAVG